jgi:hypothetical protein
MRIDWAANRAELMEFWKIRRVHNGRRLPGFGTVAIRARQCQYIAVGGEAFDLGGAFR